MQTQTAEWIARAKAADERDDILAYRRFCAAQREGMSIAELVAEDIECLTALSCTASRPGTVY